MTVADGWDRVWIQKTALRKPEVSQNRPNKVLAISLRTGPVD